MVSLLWATMPLPPWSTVMQAAEDAGLEAGTDEYKQAVIDAIAGGTITGPDRHLHLR